MTQLLMPGQETYMNIRRAPSPDGTPGALVFVVLVSRFHDGVSLIFNNHAALNRSYTNLDEARGYLRFLMNETAAGTEVWQIVDRARDYIGAAMAVSETEQAMLDGIRANLAGPSAELDAAHEQARQIRDEVAALQAQTGGWYAARKQAMRNTVPFRPTATRVHTKPPTPAQLDRIRRHHNGRVTCGSGQAWTLLRGIVDRGYADRGSVEYKPGTRQIRAIHLNKRGWALLGQHHEAAA